MADAWMPGARCIRAQTDGGQLGGGAPRVVWMTLGADPRVVSVWSAAQRLNQENRPCHLVWDPLTGDIAQLVPIVRAACALGSPEYLDWAPDSYERMPAAEGTERVTLEGGDGRLTLDPWPFDRGRVEVRAEGRVLREQSWGIDPRPVQARKPQQSISRRNSFDPPVADWAFLRAGGFAANTLGWAPQIRAESVVRWAFGRAARSLIHERDIADVAVRALAGNRHDGGKYVPPKNGFKSGVRKTDMGHPPLPVVACTNSM